MKSATLVIAVVLLALARPAQADLVYQYNSGAQTADPSAIPDGTPLGNAYTLPVTGKPTGAIQNVRVGLNLSGTWNGDLYATLTHYNEANAVDGFAVLLNRVGVGTSGGLTAAGYQGPGGMNVILDDLNGSADIHTTPLLTTGLATLKSDGRNIRPDTDLGLSGHSLSGAFDASGEAGLAAVFNGKVSNMNGKWTLFIADVSGGSVSTLNSWSLEIAAVPEPASLIEGGVAVLFLGGVIGLYRLKGAKARPLPATGIAS